MSAVTALSSEFQYFRVLILLVGKNLENQTKKMFCVVVYRMIDPIRTEMSTDLLRNELSLTKYKLIYFFSLWDNVGATSSNTFDIVCFPLIRTALFVLLLTFVQYIHRLAHFGTNLIIKNTFCLSVCLMTNHIHKLNLFCTSQKNSL